MLDPDRIMAICLAMKEAVITAYGLDLTATALPDRQFVADSPEAIANLCEQFTVSCERVVGFEANPSIQTFEPQRRAAAHAMRAGTFQLAICRCNAPGDRNSQTTVEAEEASAGRIYGDAGRMFNALVQAEHDGLLAGCTAVAFLDWRCPPVEGKYATGTLRVAVSLMRA